MRVHDQHVFGRVFDATIPLLQRVYRFCKSKVICHIVQHCFLIHGATLFTSDIHIQIFPLDLGRQVSLNNLIWHTSENNACGFHLSYIVILIKIKISRHYAIIYYRVHSL